MEADDLEDWKLCRRFNELFYAPIAAGAVSRCILCSGETRSAASGPVLFASKFWELTRCWGGHAQGAPQVVSGEAAGPGGAVERGAEVVRESRTVQGICMSCDVYFALKVVKGRLRCNREGCRRMLRVSEGLLKLNILDSSLRR